MDEIETAELMAKSLQWSSDRAESPAFINFEYEGGNTFVFLAVPGRKFRATIVEIADDGS